jgi:zinc/manganese transport system permease protein
VHFLFLMLVVLNLVGGFQALGTLLCVGLMMLPAAAARFWTRRLEVMCLTAIGIGIVSSVVGLLISYHASLPSGPSIILTAGALYVGSLLFAPRGLMSSQVRTRTHRTA